MGNLVNILKFRQIEENRASELKILQTMSYDTVFVVALTVSEYRV